MSSRSYKLGIVGHKGLVGSTLFNAFQKNGHEVIGHDITTPETKLEYLLKTEVVFICVPTPSLPDGSCDTSIVKSTVKFFVEKYYNGIIVIKSTVPPGTTDSFLAEQWSYYIPPKLAFVPEFLRERCAYADFTENHDVCIIGTSNSVLVEGDEFYHKDMFDVIVDIHLPFPKKFVHVTTKEAEMCKYFNNVYNSMLITFANGMYELCSSMDISYTNVKNAIVNRDHINDIYLNCNKNLRGFSGPCLPKDTAALQALIKEMKLDIDIFATIIKDNKKYTPTVFEGMRPK